MNPATSILATFPLQLEYLSWTWNITNPRSIWLWFAILALPIVLLGVRSLNGLGPMRKWVAIGMRLGVLILFLLILGGARWQRVNKDLEVIVLRDVSESTAQVKNFPGNTLQQAEDDWIRSLAGEGAEKGAANVKPKLDRIGVISFHDQAVIDAMPSIRPALDTKPVRDTGAGTNIAGAIQTGLATMGKDAMHRLLILSDGNSTMGDLDAAVNAANAAGVQIDVAPLTYQIQNEVIVESVNAPPMKRENNPFSIYVVLRSTNPTDVVGRLTVLRQGQPMDMDPYTEGLQATRTVRLHPGANNEAISVPAQVESSTIHQFKAIFEAEGAVAGAATQPTQLASGKPASAGPSSQPSGAGRGDTLLANNVAEAFTFIKGKGRVLYIDNVEGNRGQILADALKQEGVNAEHVTVDSFPNSLIELQNYDAIILANVPRGSGGISDDQQKMLASYVHDSVGGLVMIGGPDAFGAGGWQGSKLEEVLPVNMDIPAVRQLPKGALVMAMHSCEMPDGNYWGEQCAIKAVETLSERDEIGVISYAWNGPGGGGSNWDFPLQPKGDGTRVTAAIKRMQLGDMPSFDDMLDVAVNGKNGVGGLLRSDARQKHIIVISDGDPAAPAQKLLDDCKKNKISISTVTVYTHTPGTRSPQMEKMARDTGGRAYGPIESNPNQLPQIFIKEATVVRRSLISEPKEGIPLKQNPGTSDIMKGMEGVQLPPLRGMVLTSRKPNPQIEVPIFAGAANDPIMAHWQTGLGKVAVFTGDANTRWASAWVGSPMYAKFWSQMVRGVERPPMSTDFEVSVSRDGPVGKINVEAINKDSGFLNFLNMRTTVIGPDLKPRDVRLTQTGPGQYTGTFEAKASGNYVGITNFTGPKGERGMIPSGLAVNASPELRDLQSNEGLLRDIAERTGGRVFKPFAIDAAELFTREGLKITASPLPIWDILLPILLGLIIVDVATRRIAWDWASTRAMILGAAAKVQSYTHVRKVEGGATLDALRRVRGEVAESKFKTAEEAASAGPAPSAAPDPKRKFEAKGAGAVEGDISQVVGGATEKPIPSPPKKIEPKGNQPDGPGGHTNSLLEAKRRARKQIEDKEKGDQ